MRAAGEALRHAFQVKLSLPFEPEKATMIANSSTLLTAAARDLPTYFGAPAMATRRLGIDHSLDARSQAEVWNNRHRICRRRRGRLRALRKAGAKSPRVFTAGIFSSARYAAELREAPPSAVKYLRRWALEARGLSHVGTSIAAGASCLRPRDDPGCVLAAAPLLSYHQEWWDYKHAKRRAQLNPKQLVRSFQAAKRDKPEQLPYHKANKDPISAAIRAAAAVGWSFRNANILLNANG